MSPSVTHSNAGHHRRSAALTEVRGLPARSHWTCGEPGREAVADLSWTGRSRTRGRCR
jgi:hypothetical protein